MLKVAGKETIGKVILPSTETAKSIVEGTTGLAAVKIAESLTEKRD
jgi:hypothetical protein